MARIRSVKPEFHSDERLARDLTRDQRLFYIGMWNEADDEGRLRANSRKLMGAIFPYEDDLDESFVEGVLVRLAETDRAILYSIGGERICQLTKFPKHQKVNKPTPSKLPPPPKKPASVLGWLSRNAPGGGTEGSGGEVEVEVEVEVEQGSVDGDGGVSAETCSGCEGVLAPTEPLGQPVDRPAFLEELHDEYPFATEILASLKHEGGPKATAATLRYGFLYDDDEGTLGDPVVKGLPLERRKRLVVKALLEYRDQGHEAWNRPLFTGFVKRLRDHDPNSPSGTSPAGPPVDSSGQVVERAPEGEPVPPEQAAELLRTVMSKLRHQPVPTTDVEENRARQKAALEQLRAERPLGGAPA